MDRGSRFVIGRLLAVSFVVLAAGCTRHVGQMETRPLARKNPGSYDFALPLEELRSKVLEALTIGHQVEQPIFAGFAADPVVPNFHQFLSVVEAREPLFGEDILRLPENSRDLYLHSFGMPLYESPVYRVAGKGLPFFAEFHLHFSVVDETRTRITVTARRTAVVNGESAGVGHNGPGWFDRSVHVPPTSVEEYMILRYVGTYAGDRSMPPVIQPAA